MALERTVACLRHDVVASGDDDGGLILWDLRQRAPALSFSEHSDFISDILHARSLHSFWILFRHL